MTPSKQEHAERMLRHLEKQAEAVKYSCGCVFCDIDLKPVNGWHVSPDGKKSARCTNPEIKP